MLERFYGSVATRSEGLGHESDKKTTEAQSSQRCTEKTQPRISQNTRRDLGVGGTVGVDALALTRVDRPEVEIRDGNALTRGFLLTAANTTVRGLRPLCVSVSSVPPC